MSSHTKRQTAYSFYKKLLQLAVSGGIVFWIVTIVTSLLPIAAEYRAHFTNWRIQTVWVDSMIVGIIVGACVSYSLLRFMEKNPTGNLIQKSVLLSLVALVTATLLIDVPRSFLLPGARGSLYYFLVGAMFNAARFLALGLMIGYLSLQSVFSIHIGDKK